MYYAVKTLYRLKSMSEWSPDTYVTDPDVIRYHALIISSIRYANMPEWSKGGDSRSSGHMSSWVRTPLFALISHSSVG